MPHCWAYGEHLHPHHYFSRKNLSVKYDPMNGLWLCAAHHAFAHSQPEEFEKILLYYNARNQAWLDELTQRKNQIITVSPALFRQDQKIILLEQLRKAA